ncbi:ORF088L [Rock bream iridovirus]|uniref:ORF088L n=1 Tax=Rock bream iridovirus TaxID=263891 RepID=Q5YEZ9_ISKNV|nr:ORF088L [Rock bream iridovirus]
METRVLDAPTLGSAIALLRQWRDPTVEALMNDYPTTFLVHVLKETERTRRPIAEVFTDLTRINRTALDAAARKWKAHKARSGALALVTGIPWHPVAGDMGVFENPDTAWCAQRCGPVGGVFHVLPTLYRTRFDPDNPVYYLLPDRVAVMETEAMYEQACEHLGYPAHEPRVSKLAAAKLMFNALFTDVDLSDYISRMVDVGYGVQNLPAAWANLYPLLTSDHAHRAAFIRMQYTTPHEAFKTMGAHAEFAGLTDATAKERLEAALTALRAQACTLYSQIEDDVANGRTPTAIPLDMARTIHWSDASMPVGTDAPLPSTIPTTHAEEAVDGPEAVISTLKAVIWEALRDDNSICARCGEQIGDGRPVRSMQRVFCSVDCAASYSIPDS